VEGRASRAVPRGRAQEETRDATISYNIFRWYRAGWGRYTQADPAEFEGGFNLYAYSLNNPIARFDSNGLTSYKGFPSDEKQKMEEAVKKAIAKLSECPSCAGPYGPPIVANLERQHSFGIQRRRNVGML